MALVAEGFRGSHQPGLTLLWPRLEFWESSLGALIDRMLGQACVAPEGMAGALGAPPVACSGGKGSCFRKSWVLLGRAAQGALLSSPGILRIYFLFVFC